MNEEIENLARELSGKLGNLVGVRVYMTITDQNGNFVFADANLEAHKDFIQTFVKNNFNYLSIGDHSIPLSSKNIIFFKTTESSIAVLHNPKGKVGQLLLFRKIMNDYTDLLNKTLHFSDEIPEGEKIQVPIPMEISQIQITSPIFSREDELFQSIYPYFNPKTKVKEKFTFTESNVLSKSDGKNNLKVLLKEINAEKKEILDAIYKFVQKNFMDISTHEMIKISCPECHEYCYGFVPKYFTEKYRELVRFQIFPHSCSHTCIVLLDKKDKFLTKKIDKLMALNSEIDVTKLSIKNLIGFLGQDLFFNIFHAIFFRIPIVFIGDEIESYIEQIVIFLKRIFPDFEYGKSISCISTEDYKKKAKTLQNSLIIDFYSNTIKELGTDRDYFNFEFKLFKNILKLEDDNLQILKTNSEFEKLILNTDKILTDLQQVSEISEDDLIDKMKDKFNIIIDHSDIPVIKKIAEIYYEVDVIKKIKSTVSGQLSSFFDII